MKSTDTQRAYSKMAAVIPQTILYKFARYYPAASVMKAANSQSRWDGNEV